MPGDESEDTVASAVSRATDWIRSGVRSTYRECYDNVNPEEIVGDAIFALTFMGIAVYGLWSTLSTPTSTVPGAVGALAVMGIEAGILYYGSMHGLAAWHVYCRSEPRYKYCESLDGYVRSEGEDS